MGGSDSEEKEKKKSTRKSEKSVKSKGSKDSDSSSSSSSSDEDDGIGSDVALILDCGSGYVKAGFSNEEKPKFTYQTMVGRAKPDAKLEKEFHFAESAEEMGNKVNIKYPVENGIIENFEEMEKLWEWTFYERMKANPELHPILLTEPPYNPKKNREKMVELMFEQFAVPSLNVSVQGVLSLLGHGRTTGLVLDSGDGVTVTLPIFDGFGLPHCINRMDTAGKELNSVLAKLLAQSGKCMTTTSERHALQDIKEKHCYCAINPVDAAKKSERVTYKLPDGTDLTMRDELWRTCEGLFTPAMAGLDVEGKGVHQMVYDTISMCDLDVRKTMTNNIVLAGGSTMFPGFKERLAKELDGLVPSANTKAIRVLPSKDGRVASFVGAQIFCCLRAMQEDKWMSHGDYEEKGVGHIHEMIAVKYK